MYARQNSLAELKQKKEAGNETAQKCSEGSRDQQRWSHEMQTVETDKHRDRDTETETRQSAARAVRDGTKPKTHTGTPPSDAARH